MPRARPPRKIPAGFRQAHNSAGGARTGARRPYLKAFDDDHAAVRGAMARRLGCGIFGRVVEGFRSRDAVELDNDHALGPPFALEIVDRSAAYDELAAVLLQHRRDELTVLLVPGGVGDLDGRDEVGGHGG